MPCRSSQAPYLRATDMSRSRTPCPAFAENPASFIEVSIVRSPLDKTLHNHRDTGLADPVTQARILPTPFPMA